MVSELSHPFRVVWVIVAGVIIISLTICLLPVETMEDIVEEYGVVENFTVAGYFTAAILLLLDSWREDNRQGMLAALVVFMLGLRELDFHEIFTTMGIFKTRFYISPDVPIVEKCIVTVIVLVLLVSLVLFLIKNFEAFVRSWRRRDPWAVTLGAALVFIVMSKMIDSMSGPLVWFFSLLLTEPEAYSQVIEEVMELAIPLFILLSVYDFYPSISHADSIHLQSGVHSSATHG